MCLKTIRSESLSIKVHLLDACNGKKNKKDQIAKSLANSEVYCKVRGGDVRDSVSVPFDQQTSFINSICNIFRLNCFYTKPISLNKKIQKSKTIKKSTSKRTLKSLERKKMLLTQKKSKKTMNKDKKVQKEKLFNLAKGIKK